MHSDDRNQEKSFRACEWAGKLEFLNTNLLRTGGALAEPATAWPCGSKRSLPDTAKAAARY